MRDTGNELLTELTGARPASHRGADACTISYAGESIARRPRCWLVLCALFCLAGQALALDLFTLWQRPELPLNLEAGLWADYRRQAHVDGRRSEDLLRILCLGQCDRGHWVIEVVPLVEVAPDVFEVVPGEGLRLHLSPAVASRRDGIMQVVEEVRLWRDGAVRELDRQEWRQDPLVTASFSGDFRPDLVQELLPAVRVIAGRELVCSQFVFSAADTQAASLPQGRVVQAVSQQVEAMVHEEIPLLGLAHVSERLHAESWLEPPGQRRLPPPQVRIETLECLDFGRGASTSLLPRGDLHH